MTDKTDAPAAEAASEWQQLTPAEINAIVKQAQARKAEDDQAQDAEPVRRGRKPGKPADANEGE